MWALARENLSLWFENNKGADQSAHPRSLISASVFRILVSIISKLATSEISTFQLVPVTEETGFHLALLETLKTGFVASRPMCSVCEWHASHNYAALVFLCYGPML